MPIRFRKASKYGNRKVTYDGITFDSTKEYKHYLLLQNRLKQGEIFDLILQPKFPIIINGKKVFTYIADFSYMEGNKLIVVDVKSEVTRKLPVYRIKKKCVEAYYGFTITEV